MVGAIDLATDRERVLEERLGLVQSALLDECFAEEPLRGGHARVARPVELLADRQSLAERRLGPVDAPLGRRERSLLHERGGEHLLVASAAEDADAVI